MQVFDNRFQAKSRWILTLLRSSHQKATLNLPVPNVSRKLMMMGREDARNM